MADYGRAIRLDPSQAAVFYDRAMVHTAAGDLDRAVTDFTEAARLDPKRWEALYARGRVFCMQGESERALADLSEAIRLDPTQSMCFALRSDCRLRGGDGDGALKDAAEWVRLDPKSASARMQLGNVRMMRGDWADARADYDEAVRLGPKDDRAHSARARFLATCPDDAVRDGRQALKDAERAVALTGGKDPFALEALAAATAEAGDYAKAAELQKKAIEHPQYRAHVAHAKRLLAGYEANRPARQPDPKRKPD
jgi:tetratricopeptide (TPR) repeat protein